MEDRLKDRWKQSQTSVGQKHSQTEKRQTGIKKNRINDRQE